MNTTALVSICILGSVLIFLFFSIIINIVQDYKDNKNQQEIRETFNQCFVSAKKHEIKIEEANCKTQKDKEENLEKIIDKIKLFSNLKDNWNSYGAKPLDRKVIEGAIDICKQLQILPDEVFPCGDGSVQFEYYGEDEKYLQFNLYDNLYIDYFYEGYELNYDGEVAPHESSITTYNDSDIQFLNSLCENCKSNCGFIII